MAFLKEYGDDSNNFTVTNAQDRHNRRPIPQTFIDALQDENGNNLSDAEKDKWQNVMTDTCLVCLYNLFQ